MQASRLSGRDRRRTFHLLAPFRIFASAGSKPRQPVREGRCDVIHSERRHSLFSGALLLRPASALCCRYLGAGLFRHLSALAGGFCCDVLASRGSTPFTATWERGRDTAYNRRDCCLDTCL